MNNLRHLFPFCLLRSRQHILGDLQLYLMQLYSLLALKIERYSFLNIKQTKRLFRPPYWKQVTSHFSQELSNLNFPPFFVSFLWNKLAFSFYFQIFPEISTNVFTNQKVLQKNVSDFQIRNVSDPKFQHFDLEV